MRYHMLLAGAVLLFLTACQSDSQKEDNRANVPPNIIFILADDLGWADLPTYGNTFNEAPNISRLSKQGMQYMNAYAAAPVCSPTRASIQSGQYPARVGIIDFIPGHWRPYEEVIVPSNRSQYLPDSIITIGETLQSAGYATAYYGKWHLGTAAAHMPGEQGYDDWRIHRGGPYYQLQSSNAMYPADSTLGDSVRLSEALTDYSLSFIEAHQQEPFFLFLSHYDVHVQLDADSSLIQKYLNKEKPEQYPGNAVYAAMIEHLDRSVGRIMDKLDALGISEQTMIIFYSDNGGLIRRFDNIPLLAQSKLPIYEGSNLQYVASSNAPLRGEKGTVYEGGIREPLIIKWPKGIQPPDSNREQLISSVDIYPTLMEIAGASPPAKQLLDGRSIINYRTAATGKDERPLFWHYPVYHHDVPASAVRQGDWKLIQYLDDQRIELYNLAQDIGETKDLATIQPDKARSLLVLLDEWRKETAARLPQPNADFAPNRRQEWGKHPDRE
jgi:uncharacterized sulfatase